MTAEELAARYAAALYSAGLALAAEHKALVAYTRDTKRDGTSFANYERARIACTIAMKEFLAASAGNLISDSEASDV